jgi:putative ABC transport system permease protein
MWKHHLRVALRGLRRQKGYAFINVAGLAAGMACCLLILLFVADEYSYDRFHANAGRIHRLAMADDGVGAEFEGIAKVPGAWGPGVLRDFPEVEQAARLMLFGEALVRRGERQAYEDGGLYADPALFEVFSFPLVAGDPATALNEPNTVVLTRGMAERYFPGEDPLGQALTFEGGADFRVTGVTEDVPANAHFTFTFLVSLATDTTGQAEDWVRNQSYTYLLLREGARPEALAARFPDWLRRQTGAEAAAHRPLLQPLTRIHLHSRLFRELAPNGDAGTVHVFALLAAFILLIAGVNFVNLATARASRRAKEVGVRKAVGASRASLVRQFLGESLLLSVVAAVMAAGLVLLVLPAFNAVTGKAFAAGLLLRAPFLPGLAAAALLVGLAAGSYPAAVLSTFRPAHVLRGAAPTPGRGGLRRGLVVVQFTISAFLLIATAVVYRQLDFIRQKGPGFDAEQLVTIPLRDPALVQHADALKAELRRHPGVVDVAVSANLPDGSDWGIPVEPEGVAAEDAPFRILAVDPDFLATYGMEVAEGRGFSRARPADATHAFMINEEAARLLGWARPTEHTVAMPAIGREAAPVIGVVRDFHFRSMHEAIGPLLLFIPPPDWFSLVTVRIRPEGAGETLAFLEARWRALDPGHPFTYEFFDEQVGQFHEAEDRLGKVLGAFALLAVGIACLGLFGLAAFAAERRTKEVGVRKVLGASAASIVVLLSRDFVALVAAAFVVAAPLAHLAMSRWLEGFAYRTAIGPGVFAAAGALALLIALATVSLQALRAASSDPVKALRYE